MEKQKKVKEFYQKLRKQQEGAKEQSKDKKEEINAIIKNHGLDISQTSFVMVENQMIKKGFTGIPYLDMKTFKKWQENGFIVKRGEKSEVKGIVWLDIKDKKTGEDKMVFPKVYHLFHNSQVEKIA